jgi:hypothetical protein
MPNAKHQSGEMRGPLLLTDSAALAICKKHMHVEAATLIVRTLQYYDRLKPAQITKLVEDQILMFERSLVTCVERANFSAGKVEFSPGTKEQGAALRANRAALENLRDSVESNWKLVQPLIGIDTAQQLGRLLTTAATEELLPANLRSEYVKRSADKDE